MTTLTLPETVQSNQAGGKILIVDDDQRLGDALMLYLKRTGYNVAIAYDGVQGLEAFQTFRPDLVLLDVMMPRLNGWDTARRLREMSYVPIIMLTARGQENDRVTGLKLGADDYVAKPFSLRELEARIEAVLRRARLAEMARSGPLYQDGYLTIDASGWDVTREGQPVDLTATERKLLFLLVENTGSVLSADTILEKVWGKEYADRPEYVKLYIWRLRQKLEVDPTAPRYIVTERGRGYRFVPAEGAQMRR
ncbi:MAG: response regulator transcription factor [Anaerolineae bacterium]|nr:response regulator transcription factor [Anaerolineae bacterium]